MPELTKNEILMKLRDEACNQMRQHVDLVWSNAKFSISILSILLSILVGISVFGIQNYSDFPDIVGFKLIIFLIPSFLSIFILLSLWNLKREYKRVIEDVVFQAKIDDELGISEENYREQHRVFPDDKHILPTRWIKDRKNINLFPSDEDFIKECCKILKKKDGKRELRRTLYVYMVGISILFITICIGFLTYGLYNLIGNIEVSIIFITVSIDLIIYGIYRINKN